jgi:O-antigen/teichoic acid export membrane protein
MRLMFSNKKILGNAFAQFGGKFVTMFTSFLIVKLITAIGVSFYGQYVTAYEFLAFFGIIADMGLFAVAVREISKSDTEKNPANSAEFILGNILSLRLLLVLGVIFFAGISAQFVSQYSADLKLGIWITAISMGLTIVAGTLSSVLQARMKIQKFSSALVTGKIILAALIFFILKNTEIFAGFNIFFILLWAGVISNLVFSLLVWYFVSREIKIRLLWDTKFIKKTLRDTLSYGLALVLQTLYLRIDMILISMILGISFAGIYGVATRVLESILVLGVFFGQAMLPQISAQEKDAQKSSASLVWGIEKLLIFSIPIVIGVSFFSRDLVLLLSSSNFLSTATEIRSDKILQILIPTVFFAFFNQLFTFTLVAKNLQRKLVWINGSALALNAILNLIFLREYGIVAAAISTVICEILVFILLSREIRKHFTFPFSAKNLNLIFLANLAIFAEIFFTPLRDNLLLAVLVCGITYFGILGLNFRGFLNSEK